MSMFGYIHNHISIFLCIPSQEEEMGDTRPASAGWKQQHKCHHLEMIICSYSRGHGGKGSKRNVPQQVDAHQNPDGANGEVSL